MQTEKEIRESIPLSIPSKTIKYLGINLMKETKDLLNENYRPLKNKIEVDIRSWKDLPCSGIRRINIVKNGHFTKNQSTCSMKSLSKF
jgi:hypothetical protein